MSSVLEKTFDRFSAWRARMVMLLVSVIAVNRLGDWIGWWDWPSWVEAMEGLAAIALLLVILWSLTVQAPAEILRDAPSVTLRSSEGATWRTHCQVVGDSVLFELHPLYELKADHIFCVVEDPTGASFTSGQIRADFVRDGASFWRQFPNGFPGAESAGSGTYKVTWCTRLTSVDVRVLARSDYEIDFGQSAT